MPVDQSAVPRRAVGVARDTIHIGLLGLGQVGTAFASLVERESANASRPFVVDRALVREPASRLRPRGVVIETNPRAVLDRRPDVVVEVLGDLEPARTLVLDAIERGIPVVTANKSLLAHHGDELAESASAAGVPLFFEASVIAGVPFLSPLIRRSVIASSFVSFSGILNGTTNFILSKMANTGGAYDAALNEACRLGFAEPDPFKDVAGLDALEKLIVLLRQLALASVHPGSIEVTGITHVKPAHLRLARALGGTIKPVVHARWNTAGVEAFAGIAFLPNEHALARLDGVTNGICLQDRAGRELLFAGPGAGPEVTAVTVLDDVIEAIDGKTLPVRLAKRRAVTSPSTPWFLHVSSPDSPSSAAQLADLLAAHGVSIARTCATERLDGFESVALITSPCCRDRIDAAVAAIESAAACTAVAFRALGGPS